MGVVFANNASTSLKSSCGASETSIKIKNGLAFPAVADPDFMYLTITQSSGSETTWEIVKVTAHTYGSETLSVERGQEGTTARIWGADSKIECRVTKGGLALAVGTMVDLVVDLTASLGSFELAKYFTIVKEVATAEGRFRLYNNESGRTSDLTRTVSTAQPSNVGIMLEDVFEEDVLEINYKPCPCYSADANYYWSWVSEAEDASLTLKCIVTGA